MHKQLNILVATDYSEAIMNAEHFAVQLARNDGIFLRFLHVFAAPGFDQVGSFEAEKIDRPPAFYELNKLKEHVAKLLVSMNCKPGEVKYECLVREGSPARQIEAEIKESIPDFVLMGAHGAAGFREFVLGSQAWKVVKKGGAPVFVLPKDTFYTGIKNIVYAAEYRDGELPVINFLSQFAARFNATVTLLHITESPISEETEKKISKDFMDKVKTRVGYGGLELKIEHATDIVRGIEDFAEKNRADLLVMSHVEPGILEKIFSGEQSVAKKMSVHTTLPLLIIPDFYNPDFSWFWRLFALDYSMDRDF